uniref:ABC transporter permease n=1 Tax=Ignisphaera aggregans TaxID=334771 RepID=A0A7C5Z4V5_9CREN
MRIADIFLLAFKALLTHKIRTSLLVLSVAVGVAAIVTLTAQTEGVGRSIISTLQSLGPDTIIVNVMGRGLTDADIAVVSTLENVRKVIPVIREMGSINLGGSTVNAVIYGISSDGLKEILGDLKLVDGSPYQEVSIPLAVVGNQIAISNTTNQLIVFPGQVFMVNTRGTPTSSTAIGMVVSGILDKYGAMSFISPDTSIFIPLQAAQQILNRKSYNMLIVKVSDSNSVDSVVESLRSIYGGTLNAMSPTQIAQTMQSIILQISILLGGIAAISLIAAALGIFNMMLVTITERTKEIGTMKALGFKNKHILAQIILEGFLIGVLGGVVGIAVGAIASYMLPNIIMGGMIRSPAPMARTPQFASPILSISYKPYINPFIVLTSFMLALLVSVFSSLYPAWRAAKMDPVRALKYE